MHRSVAWSWPLRTSRLELRPFETDDLDGLVPLQADPETVRYVPYGPRDRTAVATSLQAKIAGRVLRAEGDLLSLAVTLRTEPTLVGDLLLVLVSVEHETLELGYTFARGHWRQGYGTEAVRALLDLAFGPIGARRVVARVDSRNQASRALLARLGFRLEAVLVENEWFKGEYGTEVDYAILRREWSTPARRGTSASSALAFHDLCQPLRHRRRR